MNFVDFISRLRRIFVVVAASAVAGAWGFVIAIPIANYFDLDETKSLTCVAIPLFYVIFVWGVIYLPRALRRAGMID